MSNTTLSRDQIRHIRWPRYPVVADVMNALVDGSRLQWVPEGARWRQDQNGSQVRRAPRSLRPADWVLCKSDDDVPSYGVVEAYDEFFDDAMNQGVLNVRKATSSAQYFAGCEDYPLQAGAKGWVRLISPYAPVRVSAVYGQALGFLKDLVVSDTSVTEGNDNGRLLSLGKADRQGRVAVIVETGAKILIAQTTVSHAKGATQPVNVFRGPVKGAETHAAGDVLMAYLRFGGPIAAGKWIGIAFINTGWEIICAEC